MNLMWKGKNQVKDTVINNKGFTLIELMACIALLAVLVVFAVPNVYKYLITGYSKTMSIQEKNVADAANLYLQDFCVSPINPSYKCATGLVKNTSTGFAEYSGYIKLSTIKSQEYIEDVKFRSKDCVGYVEIENSKAKKTYLKCGDNETEGYDDEEYNGAA